MYVDDLADALVHLLKTYSDEEHVNVGVGYDITICKLAEMVMRTVGLKARIRFDPSKPDGTPRKLLDSGRLFATGWRPKATLADGLRSVYAWYLETHPPCDRPDPNHNPAAIVPRGKSISGVTTK
jgi:GDP-L-fucose synthase